ncbi:MAG: hypothetical protein GY938_16530, partial [Ketobacter sp.]|nr:hypothetical protein [Ketobacter sp.]
AHSGIALTNAPTLVDGSIYTISFAGTDAAGNAATPVSATSVTYDAGTETPTLASPSASSTDNATVAYDFTLPEAAASGTVTLTFTRTSGTADANAPHVITFNSNKETAANHTGTLVGADLSTSTDVSSVSSGVNDALLDGAIYSVKVEYQDASSNTAANATNASFTYDSSAPTFTSTSPSTSTTVASANVSYTLSEAIASGTVTYSRTGGTADVSSPHTANLTGVELNTGAHSGIALTNAPTLVDGSIYTISFAGTDAAGNAATPVSATSVTYDAG